MAAQGRRFYAAELVQRITGRPLSAEPLLAHLRRKVADLYAA
jgi:Zn-dependent M32 family carboxypeptidase